MDYVKILLTYFTLISRTHALTGYLLHLANILNSSETIRLADYNIPVLNTSEFEQFENVTSLTLIHCKIGSIESDFFSVFDLSYLNLEDNELQELPTEGLDNLETLMLNENEFTSLGFLRKLTNLKMLVLDKNPIMEMKKADFAEMMNLEKFYCRECVNLKTVEGLSFSTMTKLVELNFHKTNISSTDGLLVGLPALKTLRIGNNLQSPVGKTDFSDLGQLELLLLASNNLKTVDVQYLPKSVKTLDLSYNAIDEISDTVLNAFANLENLQLGNQNVSSVKLQGSVFGNAKLNVLNLENNNIADFSTAVLGNLQSKNISATLSGNAFNCTCHDLDLWKWSQGKQFSFIYPCKYPRRLLNFDLLIIDEVSLGCIPPWFTSETEQKIHFHPREDMVLKCEAKSYYDKPILTYGVTDGNPLGISNDTAIIRYITWETEEIYQLRYYAAISFTLEPDSKKTRKEYNEKDLEGSINCTATNKWGSRSQVVRPKFWRPGLLLPIWAIATITCAAAVIIMIAIVVAVCIRRKNSDSVDMIGTTNGHVRNLAI